MKDNYLCLDWFEMKSISNWLKFKDLWFEAEKLDFIKFQLNSQHFKYIMTNFGENFEFAYKISF